MPEVYLAIPAEPMCFMPLEPEDLERKVAAMRAHVSHVAQYPDFERLLRQIARDTGLSRLSGGVAREAAESYVQIGLARGGRAIGGRGGLRLPTGRWPGCGERRSRPR